MQVQIEESEESLVLNIKLKRLLKFEITRGDDKINIGSDEAYSILKEKGYDIESLGIIEESEVISNWQPRPDSGTWKFAKIKNKQDISISSLIKKKQNNSEA